MADDSLAALAAAGVHHRAGRLEEAARGYRQLLEAEPDNWEALHRLGLIAWQGGDHEAAVELIGEAIRGNPDEPGLYTSLGRALHALGRHREAEASFRRAISIEPDHVEAHNNLGRALVALGKRDAAIAAYRRALEHDPDNAEAHNNLGFALLGQGQSLDAVAALERALALRPDYAKAHNNLGIARLGRADLGAAEGAFRRALEVDPEYPEAHNNLGSALEALGRGEAAEAAFGRALELRPDYVSALHNLARVHRHEAGDPAISRLEVLIAGHRVSAPERINLAFALGKAYDDVGRFDDAFARYREGNAGMVEKVRFDPGHHRRLVARVKQTFRMPNDTTDGGGEAVTPAPIVVIGLSRSGKSLVETLLARHPEVEGGGERREWAEALDQGLRRLGIATTFPACAEALDEAQVAAIGRAYGTAVAGRLPPCRFFVDTNPGNVLHVGLMLRALPAARVVACTREALDNALYIYFRRYHVGHDYAYDMGHIAAYLRDHRELTGHWRALLGERLLDIAYEDLVGAPEESAARLYRHVGLDPEGAAPSPALHGDEIGHWRAYQAYLGPLRGALGELGE